MEDLEKMLNDKLERSGRKLAHDDRDIGLVMLEAQDLSAEVEKLTAFNSKVGEELK